MRSVTGAVLLVAGLAAPAAAQDHTTHAESASKIVEGWKVRYDRAAQAGQGVAFETMPPGWHITTGPAVILWQPSTTASGEFTAEADIHQFDPGERREAFGLFLGGRNLEADNQSYVYFVIRRDGQFLIKRRNGAETSVIQDWTAHPAILAWDARPNRDDPSALNRLAVRAGSDTVAFLVNGQEVAHLPRAGLELDGVVGLRVNHALNLHVSKLAVGND